LLKLPPPQDSKYPFGVPKALENFQEDAEVAGNRILLV
jgi:hypothetical protein